MDSLKGSLLIASPGLVDPNFVKTVVLVAEHNAEGAFGLVLNRPGEAPVADLWSALSDDPTECSKTSFIGGPVQENAVLLLHGHEDLAGEAEPVVPGVYLGSEVELFGRLLGIADARFRVFCGYSGWGAGQLDAEMKAGGWLTCAAGAEHVFDIPPQKLWSAVMGELGGVYRFYSLMPPDPEMN